MSVPYGGWNSAVQITRHFFLAADGYARSSEHARLYIFEFALDDIILEAKRMRGAERGCADKETWVWAPDNNPTGYGDCMVRFRWRWRRGERW